MIVDAILDRKGRHIYEVSPDWPVSKAVALLAAWNVGTILATDFHGTLLGIISERDIIRSLNEFGGSVLRIRVADLMTRSVVTCAPATEISEALSLMALHRIRHLPVVAGGAPTKHIPMMAVESSLGSVKCPAVEGIVVRDQPWSLQ